MSKPECQILGPEGAALFAELHAQCFDTPWDQAAFADLLALPSVTGWVIAASEDSPLGLLLMQKAADQAELLTIGICPHSRGQGLGKLLLQEALSSPYLAEIKEIFLDVAEDNRVALALYRAMGFEEFGRRPNYYPRGEARIDALALRRIVAENATR